MAMATNSRMPRVTATCVLALALAACTNSNTAPPSTQASAGPVATPAAAEQAPAAAAPADAAKVKAMGVEELRDAASKALRENRIYAPAGDNAMEYYLALRDKQADDPGVASAMSDLMPYTLIATEQSIARENFPEAQRLIGLIEKVDPHAPSLPRLKQSVAGAQQALAQRTERDADAKVKKDAQAKVQAQQAATAQLQQQQAAAAAAAAQALEQQRLAQQARDAEQQRQAAAAAAQQQQTAQQHQQAVAAAARSAANPPSLRAISTPAPRYPAEALRAGTSGEVMVEITVGTDGSVTSSRVLSSRPARIFDREAVNTVRRWKFEPVSSPVTVRRTLVFNPGA
jgi:protein TonB